MASYDVSKPRRRTGLYRTVLHEGLRDDLPRYLNQDLLLQLWPLLRALVGPVLPYLTRRQGREPDENRKEPSLPCRETGQEQRPYPLIHPRYHSRGLIEPRPQRMST